MNDIQIQEEASMWLLVCVYVYSCDYVHLCESLCLCIYVYINVYMCVYVCICICMCVYICAFLVCGCIKHVDVYIHICTYTLCACKYEPGYYVCMWLCDCIMHMSVCGHINIYTYLCVFILCEYIHMGECVHYVCTCKYVSLLCMCMILCIRVCMWAYVDMCVFTRTCVSGKRLTAQLSLLVWPVASCRVINEKGEKQSVFSACIFPFFVFIKCWLLILEVEHCHKKPFAVNKAVAAAWGVNRRPGKPCENHLSAKFTKWVRRKGKWDTLEAQF